MSDRDPVLPRYLGIKQCACGPMMFPRNDRFVGRLLDQTGEYGKAEKELFATLIKPGATVLDIGANIGAFTVPLSKMVGPTGVVVAFEPQRQMFNFLCANLALNECANTIAHNVALGDHRGFVNIEEPDLCAEMNNFGAARIANEGSQIVRMETLDIMGFQRVDFLKIDVEGYEKLVLRGGAETIRRCRPVIFMENDRKENSETLIDTILSFGYRLWWSIEPLTPDQSVLYKEDRIDLAICSIDLLCIPAEKYDGGQPDVNEVRPNETWESACQRMNMRRSRNEREAAAG